MRKALLEKFKALAFQEVQTENNWFKDKYQFITFYYEDVLFQCNVKYNEDEIESIWDIDIVEAVERETNFSNLIEFLNDKLK